MNGARTIEQLQEKLDGVYDLDQAEDCRKMIEVLLRSIREKDANAQQAQDNLKLLALMVVNGNPRARDKAREVMAGSGKTKVEVMDFLMKMASTGDAAAAVSTRNLISEVTDTVWAGLDMSSRESAVLGELIYRMKQLTGMTVLAGSESLGGNGKSEGEYGGNGQRVTDVRVAANQS